MTRYFHIIWKTCIKLHGFCYTQLKWQPSLCVHLESNQATPKQIMQNNTDSFILDYPNNLFYQRNPIITSYTLESILFKTSPQNALKCAHRSRTIKASMHMDSMLQIYSALVNGFYRDWCQSLSGLSCVNSRLQQERSWLCLWLEEGYLSLVDWRSQHLQHVLLITAPMQNVYIKIWFTPQKDQNHGEQRCLWLH